MSPRGVVGQVDSQHPRQHQHGQETQQKCPGSGRLHPDTAGASVARVQSLGSTIRSGHVSDNKSLCGGSVSGKSDVYKVGWRHGGGRSSRK